MQKGVVASEEKQHHPQRGAGVVGTRKNNHKHKRGATSEEE
jgi:hypothetical protein